MKLVNFQPTAVFHTLSAAGKHFTKTQDLSTQPHALPCDLSNNVFLVELRDVPFQKKEENVQL